MCIVFCTGANVDSVSTELDAGGPNPQSNSTVTHFFVVPKQFSTTIRTSSKGYFIPFRPGESNCDNYLSISLLGVARLVKASTGMVKNSVRHLSSIKI